MPKRLQIMEEMKKAKSSTLKKPADETEIEMRSGWLAF